MSKKRPIWSWAMYDWANSAFATTVMAAFFPIFFKEYWANSNNPSESTFYLGMANSIASIIIAVLAPFLGAIADRGTAKKKFLTFFAFLGIIMTGALWIVAQGLWQIAVLFYVVASIGFTGGNIFYDSLLLTVAPEKKVDYISSLGYALGYVGGGLLLLLNVGMYLKPELFGIPDEVTAIKLSFITVAAWWALFSIPILLFVKEPRIYRSVSFPRAVRLGWRQFLDTFQDIKHLKVVGLFLLAYWFYIDGVDTIVKMAVDYGKSLNFGNNVLITALLLVQFVAFPAALIYSWFASKIGIKQAILVAILAYSIITFFGYFMTQEWHFYVLAIMIALFQGGIQALSRSFYSRIIPEKKSAEFFGFYNMLGKFAAVLGPAMMGTVTMITGTARIGILTLLILFAVGAILLFKVDREEGERMARKYLSK